MVLHLLGIAIFFFHIVVGVVFIVVFFFIAGLTFVLVHMSHSLSFGWQDKITCFLDYIPSIHFHHRSSHSRFLKKLLYAGKCYHLLFM